MVGVATTYIQSGRSVSSHVNCGTLDSGIYTTMKTRLGEELAKDQNLKIAT